MEELLRFGIPGFLVQFPFLWWFLHEPTKAKQVLRLESVQDVGTLLAALFIAAAPVIGYIFHQVHMLIHEWWFNSSQKRGCISEIIKRYKSEEKKDITPWGAFLAWDFMSYSLNDKDRGHRDHDLRMWQWIHSFQTVYLISPLMLVVTLIIGFFFCCSLFWFVPFYLILSILFYLKQKSTLKHLNEYERVMVNECWNKIKSVLKTIEQTGD